MIKIGSKLGKALLKPNMALRGRLQDVAMAINAYSFENMAGNYNPRLYYDFDLHNNPLSLTNVFSRGFANLPSHNTLTMPALSPTMQKGSITKWLKKEGDEVTAGDVIADVETDKATVGFEVQEAGFIAKILIAEGTKDVEVGTPAVIIVESKEDLEAFKNYTPGSAAGQAKASTQTEKEKPKEEAAKSEKKAPAPCN